MMTNRKSDSASTTDSPRLRRDTADTECQTKDDDDDDDDDDDTEFQEFGDDQILTEDMAEEIYSALAGLDNTASTASTASSTTTTKDHED